MKSFISLLFLSLTPLVVIGQNASDIQNRSDSTERPQPAPLSASSDNNSGSSNISASDTGAQRPISLKQLDLVLLKFGPLASSLCLIPTRKLFLRLNKPSRLSIRILRFLLLQQRLFLDSALYLRSASQILVLDIQ